ncbi:hypothetical protein [Tamlana flava]|uniref:hypothetical protein n=1 Tax=Tamlana flava TaxID=3158572 RepID=UPI00351B53A8
MNREFDWPGQIAFSTADGLRFPSMGSGSCIEQKGLFQFGLAGRWNTCTERAGATELRIHFGQLSLNVFHRSCIKTVSMGFMLCWQF